MESKQTNLKTETLAIMINMNNIEDARPNSSRKLAKSSFPIFTHSEAVLPRQLSSRSFIKKSNL